MGWLPGSGCVLWLQMDERQGSIAYDLSGYNNHGTIYGPTWQRGKIGYALNFDGVDDYVDCGADPSLDITEAITIELWFKVTRKPVIGVGTDDQQFIIKGWGDEPATWLAYAAALQGPSRAKPGLGVFALADTTGRWHITWTDGILDDGNWHHLIGIWDGTVQKIYVDSVEQADKKPWSGQLRISTMNLLVGALYGPDRVLNGLMDEVRLYNRALSVEEIKAHYWYGLIPALRPA